MSKTTLNGRLKKVKVIVCDVDGVLTDGSIYLDDAGNEIKAFFCKDASAAKIAKFAGINIMLLTGRKGGAVKQRAKELGVDIFFRKDLLLKKKSVTSFVYEIYKADKNQILYIGDDLGDLNIMEDIGVSVAPSDGVSEAKKIADIVTAVPGGRGVLAEVVRKVLAAQGQWDKCLRQYRNKQLFTQ